MSLSRKKIVLGISGSIAAYKTPALVRLLVKAGAEVSVVLTEEAQKFVSALSLATVANGKVYAGSISEGTAWNNHVMLGRSADIMLIAPSSANTIAKMAAGLCDNLLTAVYLSAVCPVALAPAMDEDMWHHASTRQNLALLKARGNHVLPVGNGELASGLTGEGRMAEPEEIVAWLNDFFTRAANKPLRGKKVLITAGPTYEKLDPVRFIGNFSTGKMGIALAESFAEAGAEVHLVLGPTHLLPGRSDVHVQQVESAQEMYAACTKRFPDTDIAIMAAAVADYKPQSVAADKIKKTEDTFNIVLERNPDILATLGSMKTAQQFLAGFALETNDEHKHASEKRLRKNADLIVLNSLRDEGAGFGGDTNKVTLISAEGEKSLPLMSKTETADAIAAHIINSINK